MCTLEATVQGQKWVYKTWMAQDDEVSKKKIKQSTNLSTILRVNSAITKTVK